MDHRSFAEAMRHGLEDAKSKGVDVVSIDDVLTHISNLETAISEQSDQSEKALDEANRNSWEQYLEDYRAYLSARNEMNSKMFESVISAGQNAIKALLTINGGAAVAVLAFLGHLASINSSMLAAFSTPLQLFSLGVALVGAAAGGTYLSQLAFAIEKGWWIKIGIGIQIITILCGLGSILTFIYGLSEMGSLFRNFTGGA